jgi:M6 family metalloprotease-like protein
MGLISRRRLTLAAGAASLALLALPQLACAIPGTAPELVQRSGRLVVLHVDRPEVAPAQQWTLVSGTSHVPVRMPPDVWVDPGARVRLEGTMQGGRLVLEDSATAVTVRGPSPLQASARDVSAAPSVHNTAVILVSFGTPPGNPSGPSGPTWTQPANPSQPAARSLMFDDPSTTPSSLNAYYQEQTYGQIAFNGTVFGPVTIPGPASRCGQDSPNYPVQKDALYTWLADAEQAAGVSDAAYQHVVVAFPSVTQCGLNGAAGLAEVGGSHVWLNGAFSVAVIAHELGHNLGLSHAGGLHCTNASTATPLGTACSTSGYEYKDPFDAMGQSDPGNGSMVVRQMSMQHKAALNLVPASAVQVVSVSGAYHVAPMETLTPSAVELLRIPKPDGGSYFVEYRWPSGYFDSQAPAFSGVYVRTESPDIVGGRIPPNGSDTALIDMHPATGVGSAPWADARMAAGEVFNDPVRGITIASGVQDASGATLQVTMPIDTHPPGRPGRLSAVAGGTSVGLSWTAASDDFGVDSYRVTRNGAQIGAPAATDFTDTGLAAGVTVAYAVTAVDTAGNVGPAATVSVTIPDTERPSVPGNVTAQLARDGQVHLAWRAATDNSGVAGYHVLRSGSEIITTSGNAYVDTAPKPGSGPTVTYSVIAFDLAGNASFPADARPLRAALLRKLGASHLKVRRVKAGTRTRLRVTGTISDVQARCRLRIGGAGLWYPCRARADGTFGVSVPARGTAPVTLSLRDARGRVKLQTLRVR